MKKFEVGKRYEAMSGSTLIYEIISRTPKRITYVTVQHAGRYNERKSEPRTVAIKHWQNDGEVFFTPNGATVAAFK